MNKRIFMSSDFEVYFKENCNSQSDNCRACDSTSGKINVFSFSNSAPQLCTDYIVVNVNQSMSVYRQASLVWEVLGMSLLIRRFLRLLAQTRCATEITGAESWFSSLPLSHPGGARSWKAEAAHNSGWYSSLKALSCYMLMYIFMLTHLWLKLFICIRVGYFGNRNSMSICLTKVYLLVDWRCILPKWASLLLKCFFHAKRKCLS